MRKKLLFCKLKRTIFYNLTTYNLHLPMIELIKNPITTTKTDRLANQCNQYTFDVDPKLTKSQIKALIATFFKTTVLSVNTHRPPRQKRRLGPTQGNKKVFKRAIVRVPPNVNLLDIGATN